MFPQLRTSKKINCKQKKICKRFLKRDLTIIISNSKIQISRSTKNEIKVEKPVNRLKEIELITPTYFVI